MYSVFVLHMHVPLYLCIALSFCTYSNDYQQLVHCALADPGVPIKTLPPCMIKPQVLWSGKQVGCTKKYFTYHDQLFLLDHIHSVVEYYTI